MTVLSVFFHSDDPKSERLNPDLAAIWFSRFGIRIGDQAMKNPFIDCKSLILDHTMTRGAQCA